MSETEITAWISSLKRLGIQPGLHRIEAVLEALGNPHCGLPFYHVAGTNGKGSVCAMLEAMLGAVHRRVGSFTSPGSDGSYGRIALDGETISDEDFQRYAQVVRNVVESLLPKDPVTEFELLTIVAILYFQANETEAIVWETGLGGLDDSTNVVQPVVTAITNVGMDHMDFLGPSLAEIARAKAGIIKSGVPLVTAAEGEAYRIIEQVASLRQAPLYRVSRHVSVNGVNWSPQMQTISYRGLFRDAMHVKLSLLGQHQWSNAAIAMAMFELTHPDIASASFHRSVQALMCVKWPMRFEVFQVASRTIVIDGAHNAHAVAVLAQNLREWARALGGDMRWNMVFGVLADKDMHTMLEWMRPFLKTLTICQPNHPRSARVQDVRKAATALSPELSVKVAHDVDEALQLALKEEGPILVWGSLYMVEPARKAISKLETNLWT